MVGAVGVEVLVPDLVARAEHERGTDLGDPLPALCTRYPRFDVSRVAFHVRGWNIIRKGTVRTAAAFAATASSSTITRNGIRSSSTNASA